MGKEDYLSTLKKSYPDFEETTRVPAIVVKNSIANLKAISMLYLKNDVLSLTDIFQNFIDTCREANGNITLYSYSMPIFTLKASLIYSREQLVFVTDNQLGILFENNVRGGPSSCMGNRHVKKGETKIVNSDNRSIYGTPMSHYLPTRDFHEIELIRRKGRKLSETFLKTPDNNWCGYLLECVLEYPSNIQEKTNLLAIFPDKKQLNWKIFHPN